MTRPTPVDACLPLKPVAFELLLALVDGERHGYGLVRAIADRTGGLVRLEPGNLYRIIKRLLADGLVQESSRRAAPEGGERRRYYRLTPLGARVAHAELRRMQQALASEPARTLVRRFGSA
jgi:DNA-binding PadR family transcriptional regulator